MADNNVRARGLDQGRVVSHGSDTSQRRTEPPRPKAQAATPVPPSSRPPFFSRLWGALPPPLKDLAYAAFPVVIGTCMLGPSAGWGIGLSTSSLATGSMLTFIRINPDFFTPGKGV